MSEVRALKKDDEGLAPVESPEHAIVRFMGRLMTGYETMAQRLVDQAEIANERLAATEKALARQSETHLKMLEQYEELLSLRHERELKSLEATEDRKLKSAVVGDLRALVELAFKKYMNIPLNDGSGFKALIQTMSEEQQEAVFSGKPFSLTPAQLELLVAAMSKEADKEEKQTAQAAE